MDEQEMLAPIESTPVMAQLNRAEIDIQIATAKRYPRSIAKFRQESLTMATMDTETAASCFYKLKRKNVDGSVKFIEGESVRLAEICAVSWGNLRFGSRIIEENDRFVTAQGVFFDIERNVSGSIEVTRRITDKNGKKYSDDMIGTTKNAACAIAFRNAIFKAIPKVYVKAVYEQAKKTAIGDARTTAQRRQQMIEAYGKMGVTVEELLRYCDRPSVEDIGLTEIENLLGVFTAIKDNETSIDEQFRSEKKTTKPTIDPAQIVITGTPKQEEAPVAQTPSTPTVVATTLREPKQEPAPEPAPINKPATTGAITPATPAPKHALFAKAFYMAATKRGLSVAKANDWLFATFGFPSAGDVLIAEQAAVITALETKQGGTNA